MAKVQKESESIIPREPDYEIKVHKYHLEILKQWQSNNYVASSVEEVDPRCFETGIDGKNIIHRAIQDRFKSNTLIPVEVVNFLEYLVVRKPELFTVSDEHLQIPLLETSKLQIPLLFRIISLLVPGKILGSINEKCKEGQKYCPLLKVAKVRIENCRLNPEEMNTPSALSIQRQATLEHNTGIISKCIHDEIDVEKLVTEDNQLRTLLKEALSTDQRAQCSFLHNLLDEKMFDTSTGTHLMHIDAFKILLSLFPDSVFTELSPQGKTALHMAVLLYETTTVNCEQVFQTIQTLVERYPQSIFIESNNVGETPYRQLKALELTNESINDVIKATEELFKRTCIGAEQYTSSDGSLTTLTREMKQKFLYWDTKSECQFSLNLVGESIALDESYIGDMVSQSGIRFETVLDSVMLPYWKPTHQWKLKNADLPHESQHCLPNQIETQASEGENDPYEKIFDWLWSSNVKKIFTLEVDDHGPEPHSNAAIRHCLRGRDNNRNFEVSVFKWKKFDICSETLAIAAPRAREVWLYCSGNTAVLRSWACCSGLAKLHHLEKLVVNVFPKTSNDEKDCKAYEKEFQANLREKCLLLTAENIKVEIHGYNKVKPDDKSINQNNKSHANPESGHKTEDWMEKLKDFKKFAINLPKKEKPSIKVALLDDGVKLTGIKGTQAGTSFRPGKPAYFVGPCEHGTEMALCIREICPMAELYVAQLDNSRQWENQKFTIMSCHQAIRWAIDMQVDIISMSWSFRKKGTEQDEHEKIFIDLVKEAIDKNILVFGSLPDRGPSEKTREFAPVGLDGVIKIGSATPHGETVAENIYANPDFLLPGESLRNKTGSRDRGSSYATAYASGLAALALYVVKAHRQLAQLTEGEHLYKALHKAKTYEGMKIIFNRLSGQQPEARVEKGAFVQPYEVFNQYLTGYESDANPASILERIINHMLPPEVLNCI